MGEEFDPPFGGDGDFSGGIFHFGGMILAKKGYEKAGKRWHYDVFVSVHLWRYLFPANGRLAFKREAISMKKPNSKYVESVVKKAA